MISLFYDKEVIEEILCMYLLGIPISDIEAYIKIIPEDINKIIDQYSPYL